MKESQKKYLKKLLLRQKDDIEKEINIMNKNSPEGSILEWTDELSSYDNHPADLGTETYEMEKNLALGVHEEQLLEEVNESLRKMNTGTYGICDICGKEIDFERLEAVPYADQCMECALTKKRSLDTISDDRPVEEEVLGMTFGRRFLDQDMDEGDNGLGMWRILETYGSADNMQDIVFADDYEDINELYDDHMGVVDPIDEISNAQYRKQLYD